jgi:hypothetical protein
MDCQQFASSTYEGSSHLRELSFAINLIIVIAGQNLTFKCNYGEK